MVRRRLVAGAALLAAVQLLAACIPVPLGNRTPEIEHTVVPMAGTAPADISVAPYYHRGAVLAFSEGLQDACSAATIVDSVDAWPVLFPDIDPDAAVTLADFERDDVVARARTGGIDFVVALTSAREYRSDSDVEALVYNRWSDSEGITASVLDLGQGGESLTYGATARGKSTIVWPAHFFFFYRGSGVEGAAAKALAASVGAALEGRGPLGVPRVMVVASDARPTDGTGDESIDAMVDEYVGEGRE